MIRFLSWISDCKSIHSIWKFACNVFVSTEKGVANINWFFFFAVLKPILKFLYQNRKQGCVFYAVQSTVFIQWIKIQLFAVSWISAVQHGPSYALVSVNTVLIAHRGLVCCWVMGACQGSCLCWRAVSFIVWGQRAGHMQVMSWTCLC